MKNVFVKLSIMTLVTLVSVAVAQIEVLEETDEYRLIEHAAGETRIPADPQSVAILFHGFIDYFVALDAEIGSIAPYFGSSYPPYLVDYLEGTATVGPGYDLNLEAVLAAQPDLIVGLSDFHTEIYDQLARIAPTVLVDFSTDWREVLRGFAAMLGKDAQADALIAADEALVTEARDRLDRAVGDETALYMFIYQKEIRIYKGGSSTPLLYDDLGLAMPERVATADIDNNATISLEVLPEFDADHIFLVLEDADERLGEIERSPLWRDLTAVQEEQVHPIDLELWHLSFGPLAREIKIEQVLDALAEGSE